MPKDKDKDTWIIRCPVCGRITDGCKHVAVEDLTRVKRVLNKGIEIFESEAEMRDFDLDVGFGEISRTHLYSMLVPRVKLDDVILSDLTKEAIEDALTELRHKRLIFKNWGLEEVVRTKKGVTLLFTGQPGTGKTMTAEAMAYELRRPLMLVNYSHLENMWVGETEKNIEAVFKDAEDSNAILFFDEADAIFHRRGQTMMPWSNRDVNVLLKRLEDFPGIVILSSNLPRVMDKALDRRVDIAVEFEMPDAKLREKLFRKIVPKKAPVAKDVDFSELARRYPLSGGSILNVVRQAMRLAARHRGRRKITMAHFKKAAEKELSKGMVIDKDYLSRGKDTRIEKLRGYA